MGMPFAGMVRELNGYFEHGGETSKKAMNLVGDLSPDLAVLHQLASEGVAKDIADRFDALRRCVAHAFCLLPVLWFTHDSLLALFFSLPFFSTRCAARRRSRRSPSRGVAA
jgi:hypothetical protein